MRIKQRFMWLLALCACLLSLLVACNSGGGGGGDTSSWLVGTWKGIPAINNSSQVTYTTFSSSGEYKYCETRLPSRCTPQAHGASWSLDGNKLTLSGLGKEALSFIVHKIDNNHWYWITDGRWDFYRQ